MVTAQHLRFKHRHATKKPWQWRCMCARSVGRSVVRSLAGWLGVSLVYRSAATTGNEGHTPRLGQRLEQPDVVRRHTQAFRARQYPIKLPIAASAGRRPTPVVPRRFFRNAASLPWRPATIEVIRRVWPCWPRSLNL
jgi:hypothetical protein